MKMFMGYLPDMPDQCDFDRIQSKLILIAFGLVCFYFYECTCFGHIVEWFE